MYVKHLSSRVERPLKELRGFKRVTVKPNETQTVTIPLKAETLAYWDKDQHRFVVEPKKISIMVGSSSADVKLQATIEVVR
jgi:beta-glucosidase